ncbi:Peroxiredoxin-5, mitochondrial [Lamellibrachia satsuma]|nr:Peroxiredoxin-5, mitochondrial [Lamellibrachia satsuma]
MENVLLFQVFHSCNASAIANFPVFQHTSTSTSQHQGWRSLARHKLPGAFLPGCSLGHIPEYVSHFDKFQKEGYSVLACVSVNDPYVMDAWHGQYGSDEIRMLADTNCEFTKAIDMAIDFRSFLGNYRSQRYSLLVDDSIVTNVSYEPEDTGLACLLCIERSKKAQHAKNSSKDDVGYKYL